MIYYFLVIVSVVVLFFLAWSPFHIQRLGYVYFKQSESFRTVNQYIMYFSGSNQYPNMIHITQISLIYRISLLLVEYAESSSVHYSQCQVSRIFQKGDSL